MNMTYLTITRQWRIGKGYAKFVVKKTHIIICVLFITVLHFMTSIVHGLLIVVFRDRIYTIFRTGKRVERKISKTGSIR